MEENVKETEIDLKVIFNVLLKNIIPIILVTAIFASGTFVFSKFFIEKKYEASAMLIVNNKSSESTTINPNEIVAAQDLAEVYAIIIKSDTILQQIIDDLKLNINYETLRDNISVSSVNSTQVIQISMIDANADFAKKIVESIVEIAPPIIKDKVEAGSVKIISEAKISNDGEPVKPNVVKNTIIGGLVGLLLVVFIIIIKEVFNNTFKTEDDIVKTLDIPLIGVIPQIDRKELKK